MQPTKKMIFQLFTFNNSPSKAVAISKKVIRPPQACGVISDKMIVQFGLLFLTSAHSVASCANFNNSKRDLPDKSPPEGGIIRSSLKADS